MSDARSAPGERDRMREVERRQNIENGPHQQRLRDRNISPARTLDDRLKRMTFDELRPRERPAPVHACLERPDDVRVEQSRGNPRLIREEAHLRGVRGELESHDPDHEQPARVRSADRSRQMTDAHAPPSELGEQPITDVPNVFGRDLPTPRAQSFVEPRHCRHFV